MRCKAKHPECASRIFISDSLVMADAAVRMVRDEKCENICVLGVDFMSENVRAIIDDAGFPEANVYRMSSDAIGCSLAEAAQTETYEKYLREAGEAKNSLHVIYITLDWTRRRARTQKFQPLRARLRTSSTRFYKLLLKFRTPRYFTVQIRTWAATWSNF